MDNDGLRSKSGSLVPQSGSHEVFNANVGELGWCHKIRKYKRGPEGYGAKIIAVVEPASVKATTKQGRD